jgi:hypothetical protein
MRYLYGASVQGIQDFIFKTNELQEIIGASEIIKKIGELFVQRYHPSEILINAAGNIKAVFDEALCQEAVRDFPIHVAQQAYGITLSQAVVTLSGTTATQDEINRLEQKLKIQRNRVSIPLDASLILMKLSATTARPVVSHGKHSLLDRASVQKREANNRFFKEHPQLKEFKNLSDFSNAKNKIAVIHADGNGLGMLIPRLTEEGKKLSDFSQKLDAATHEAFRRAKDDTMSIRNVILGGDDMVVICNANDALKFTHGYLKYFEEETHNNLGFKLTACAGIAYAHEKYPFHSAASLAEELCNVAKTHSKNIREKIAPSSLMFHNIQSAYFQGWEQVIDEELTIRNDKQTIRCDYGPYYLNEASKPSIEAFIDVVEAYRVDGSPISRLRAWMGELYKSDVYASLMLQRINEMTQSNKKWDDSIMEKNLKTLDSKLSNAQLIVQQDDHYATPIYDVLQILSVTEEPK